MLVEIGQLIFFELSASSSCNLSALSFDWVFCEPLPSLAGLKVAALVALEELWHVLNLSRLVRGIQ